MFYGASLILKGILLFLRHSCIIFNRKRVSSLLDTNQNIIEQGKTYGFIIHAILRYCRCRLHVGSRGYVVYKVRNYQTIHAVIFYDFMVTLQIATWKKIKK